jgi:hypothetical protein
MVIAGVDVVRVENVGGAVTHETEFQKYTNGESEYRPLDDEPDREQVNPARHPVTVETIADGG